MFFIIGYIVYFTLNLNRVIWYLNFLIDIVYYIKNKDLKMAFWVFVSTTFAISWELGVVYLFLSFIKWLATIWI